MKVTYKASDTRDKYLGYSAQRWEEADGRKVLQTTLRYPSTGKPHGVQITWSERTMEVVSPPWTWKYIKSIVDSELIPEIFWLQQKINDDYKRSLYGPI